MALDKPVMCWTVVAVGDSLLLLLLPLPLDIAHVQRNIAVDEISEAIAQAESVLSRATMC